VKNHAPRHGRSAASALHTLALNLSLPMRTIVDRRPVKIAQSMTSKRIFGLMVRAIIDSPVHALRMLLEIIVSRRIIIAFTDYERAVQFAILDALIINFNSVLGLTSWLKMKK